MEPPALEERGTVPGGFDSNSPTAAAEPQVVVTGGSTQLIPFEM